MLHRLRYAQHTGSINKMTGTVEADETFIGGNARFMHADKRAEQIHGRGPEGKAIMFGLLERETGKVRRNERKATDAERFQKVLGSVARKRLTWNTMTSQELG